MDDVAELISEWLNLIMTAVDAEDLPLNISHETLQQNKILRVIKKNRVKRFLGMFSEIAENKDDYKRFYERFGECLKLGILEGSTKRATIAEADQLGGERGPHEGIAERHLLLHQREYRRGVLFAAEEFDGKEPQSTTKEGLDLGDRDDKKTLEELKIEFEPLRKLMKEVLGDKVEKVTVSDRIVDSSGVLTSSEHVWSANMERIMEAQALRDNSRSSYMVFKKTVQVNPAHSATTELKKRASTDKSDKTVKDLIWLLFGTSLLTLGFNLDEPTQFAARILRMIKLGLSIDDDDEGPDDDDEPVSRIQEQTEEVAEVISKGRSSQTQTDGMIQERSKAKIGAKSGLEDCVVAIKFKFETGHGEETEQAVRDAWNRLDKNKLAENDEFDAEHKNSEEADMVINMPGAAQHRHEVMQRQVPVIQRVQCAQGMVEVPKIRFYAQSVTTKGTRAPDSAAMRVTANCRYPP